MQENEMAANAQLERSNIKIAYVSRIRRILTTLFSLPFIFILTMAIVFAVLGPWEFGIPFDLYVVAIILFVVKESNVYIVGVQFGTDSLTIEYYQGQSLLKADSVDYRSVKPKLYQSVKGSIAGWRIVLHTGPSSKITQYATGYWDKNSLTSLYEALRRARKQ